MSGMAKINKLGAVPQDARAAAKFRGSRRAHEPAHLPLIPASNGYWQTPFPKSLNDPPASRKNSHS